MSVEVQYRGRLGNHLFQYAFGRIVAEHLGYELRCVSPKTTPYQFGGQRVDFGAMADLPALVPSYFTNAIQHLPGKRVESPEEGFYMGDPGPDGRIWNGQDVDLDGLLRDRRDRRLVFRGFFQQIRYFAPHKEKIREWFRLPPLLDRHEITPDDILLNMRRGVDYAMSGWVLSLSPYKKLLSEVPHRRVFVCGTGIDDVVKAELAPFSPIYYKSTPIDEFRFIMRFHKIVQSNSTFCWWAAYLSEAQEIYTPRPDRGYFSKTMREVDLEPPEARFRYFDAKAVDFVPFLLNPAAKREIAREGNGAVLLVSSPGAPSPTKIPIPLEQLRFYGWLLSRQERFGPIDILSKGLLPEAQIEAVFDPLVRSGAVLAAERYRE